MQILSALDDRSSLRCVLTGPEAVTELTRTPNACLLVVVPSANESLLLAELLRIRRLFPSVPVIALFVNDVSSHRATLQLGAVGVEELIVVQQRVCPDSLLLALTRVHATGVAVRLWKHCNLRLPEAAVPLLKCALRLAHAPLTAVQLAANQGWHERTLRKYCVEHDLPSPQWITGWARLLIAGHYLEDPGRTIQAVAEMLRFASASAMRNQLRRYSSLAPSELRARGALSILTNVLEQQVRGQMPPRRNETSQRQATGVDANAAQ